MSGWQVGDLALCIRDSRTPNNTTRAGSVYEVSRIWLHPHGYTAFDFVGVFNGDRNPNVSGFWGHDPNRFRKVTPNTDITGFEEPRRIPVGEDA